MSEKMYPIPFKSLMNWVVEEYAASGEIFGVRKAYHATGKSLPIFGERIETPFGPAAGPNSQLAQNSIAAGKVLMQDRVLVGIDEEAENAHILEAAKKLWGDLNHRTY